MIDQLVETAVQFPGYVSLDAVATRYGIDPRRHSGEEYLHLVAQVRKEACWRFLRLVSVPRVCVRGGGCCNSRGGSCADSYVRGACVRVHSVCLVSVCVSECVVKAMMAAPASRRPRCLRQDSKQARSAYTCPRRTPGLCDKLYCPI